MRAHGRDQRPRAGRERDPRPGGLERRERQAFQHRDAGAERCRKIEFAVHRLGCDRGDRFLQPGEIRELVQGLAGDDRAIHVGDEQGLAAAVRPHRQRVHRRAAERRADGSHVRGGRAGDVGGFSFGQRHGRAAAHHVADACDQGGGQVYSGPIGDEREDEGHGRGNLAAAWRACKALRGPGAGAGRCGADLQRQVGARARAGRAPGRHHRQRGFDAGLSRAARADGPARARGGGARSPRAVRRAFRRRGGQRRLVALGGARCDGGGADGRAGADPVRRHRPLPRLARGRPRRHPRSGRGRADRGTGAAPEIGPAALHARLAERDPDTAARLRPSDSQRIARAWEVWRGTGRGLAAWQAAHTADEPGWTFSALLLDPPRPALRAAIATRFGAMMEQGALGEVRALRALGLPPALPAMRAHGVPELSAFLDGTISLEEAAARAVAATGRYTKRQATWFRHHSLGTDGHQRTIHARWNGTTQFSEKDMADLCSFVRGLG